MNYKRLSSLLLAAALTTGITAGLTACKQPVKDGETNTYQGTGEADMVVLDITSEPADLNSLRVRDIISASVLNHCMAGLYSLDAEDRPVADMAERCEINEDGSVYTVYLRKDGRWSNGDPVTAHDFYFSWVSQMKKETGSSYASYFYDNIKNGLDFYEGKVGESQLGLKVVDDYTLEIKWSHPMATGLALLAMPAYYPMNQKAYESIGEVNYAREADRIVTNGPYSLTEWVHDDHIILEKNMDYYNADAVLIPKAKLVMIGDAAARLNAFMAGEIDLCNVYSAQIEQLKKSGEKEILVYNDGGSWFFRFNTEDSLLSNQKLRKALAYSVDTQSLLDHVINDGSVAADGLIPGIIAGADEAPYAKARGGLFAYDPEMAKGFLDEALKELGITAEGLKLKLSATDTSYNQTQAAYIQQQWKKNLGIDVELRIQAYSAQSESKKNGDYQVLVDGWGPDLSDAMSFFKIFTTDDPSNSCNYSNPEYDSLISSAFSEGDEKLRQEQMIQAEKILIEDMPMGPLYFTSTSYVISDKLEGLVRTPFQYFSIRNGAVIKEPEK